VIRNLAATLRRALPTIVSIVSAHHLASLLGPGGGASLGGDHAGYQVLFAVTVAGLLLILACLAWLNLRRLGRLSIAAQLEDLDVRDTSARRFLRSLITLSAQLAAATITIYVIQENLERLAGGEAPTGLAVLGGVTIPVILVVALTVAAVDSLVRLGRDIRALRRRTTPRRRPRATIAMLAPVDFGWSGLPMWLFSSPSAERAPPLSRPQTA
jgi:hypothetical protein